MDIIAGSDSLGECRLFVGMFIPVLVIPAVGITAFLTRFHIGECISLAGFHVTFAFFHQKREIERLGPVFRGQTIPDGLVLRIVSGGTLAGYYLLCLLFGARSVHTHSLRCRYIFRTEEMS